MSPSRIPSFKDLDVWQKAMNVAEEVYVITLHYPPDERFGLTAETRKTARSVPSNIAEGKNRLSPLEFRHFISIALGSSAELQTQIILAGRLKYINPDVVRRMEIEIEEIGRMVRGLERALA